MNVQASGDTHSPHSSINIIRAEIDRAGDVLKLLREAALWMESKGIKQWSPTQFNELDIAGYFQDRQVYMALDGENVAGMFTLQFSDPQYWGPRNDETYAYLHRLAVAEPYRGAGLGPQLLMYAADLAQELGYKSLRFDTLASNIKLNRFYQGLGFHFMGINDVGGGRLVNLYEHFKESADSDELILRYFAEADFDSVKSWSVSPEFLKQWAGPSLSFPLVDEQLKEYMNGANDTGQSTMLIYSAVHKGTQQVVGHLSLAGIDRVNGSARIGRVVVDPQYQGRGFGQRMIQEVLRIGFDSLELHRLSLGVYAFNTAAISTYMASGFIQEGIQREAALFGEQYVDCIEMSLLDREWRGK